MTDDPNEVKPTAVAAAAQANHLEQNNYLTKAMTISCGIGILLSCYALHVEIHAETDASYEAMCDLSESVSCSKVFTSKYAKGFGIVGLIFGEDSRLNQPNSLLGIVFYMLLAVLGFGAERRWADVQVVLASVSNLASIYLAYLLYYVLEDLCIVCVSTYAVNLANLIIALRRRSTVTAIGHNGVRKQRKSD